MKQDKITEILFEMYRRAFAASTPKGDFDKLVENAVVNKDGIKEIPFMDYECEHSVMEEIVKNVLKEKKVPKHKHDLFYRSFMLGCSPKTKKI
jgi:hypothetical protein